MALQADDLNPTTVPRCSVRIAAELRRDIAEGRQPGRKAP